MVAMTGNENPNQIVIAHANYAHVCKCLCMHQGPPVAEDGCGGFVRAGVGPDGPSQPEGWRRERWARTLGTGD